MAPILALAALWLALCPSAAQAHATGENYVWLNVEEGHLSGRFEIQVADVAERFDLEVPSDLEGRQAAIAASADRVQAYLAEHYAIRARGELVPYEFVATDVADAGELAFARYYYRSEPLDVPDVLEIRNGVLLDGDRFHRSLLCIQYDRRSGADYGEEFSALVFGPSNRVQELDLTDIRGLLRVRDFVWQGVLHIWIGIDHVLFLIALLLTAVLVRREGAWRPVESFKHGLWNVVKIVTLFTIAHSITLSLAALDFLRLPSRLVESAIALSIVLVALNNLLPRAKHAGWAVILFFGLFHGMGFASVMGDLPFRMHNLVQVVLAFNIGVELGQLAIVLVVFPLIFVLRTSRLYQPVVLVGGSIATGLVALYWFATRALGIG